MAFVKAHLTFIHPDTMSGPCETGRTSASRPAWQSAWTSHWGIADDCIVIHVPSLCREEKGVKKRQNPKGSQRKPRVGVGNRQGHGFGYTRFIG